MIFRDFVIKNFPFLEDDFDALTDYQLFCKMVGYMKDSLEKIKGYQEEIDKFSEELKSFEQWFDNLDVTDEVNAKLDEMVEDGTMEELIAEYLQLATMYVYDSVADMKSAENLASGMFAKTYGYYSYNDGGGAYYKIREVTVDDVVDDMFIISLYDNTLVAEYIVQNGELNIKTLGCKGDHETDNTEMLQAIINKAQSTGYEMIIPVGEYLISDTLYINDNIRITGIGRNRLWSGTGKYPLIYGTMSDRPFIHISKSSSLYGWDSSASNRVENVHINNIRMIGSQSGDKSLTGIFAHCYLSTFKDLEINGFINDVAIADCYETLFENCQFTQTLQGVVSYKCNRTTIFNDCWINGGDHESGSVINDSNYTTKYTICHIFNYCCFYSNLSFHFFNNIAFENNCYGLISRDSKIEGDIVNFETLSDYCVHASLNLRPNDSYTRLDHCHFYIPSESAYSGAKMFYTSYHSYLTIKTSDALPISNLAYGDMVNKSVARVYSYISGERIIPLTLSNNVSGATIVNKSHYTDRGFMIDYQFSGQSSWSSSAITTISGLPESSSFGSSDYYYFTNPTTTADTIFNARINGAGNMTTSAGGWIGGAGMGSIVKIQYEYPID